MSHFLVTVVCLAILPPTMLAQSFEVATVKVGAPVQGDKLFINLGNIQHGTLTLTNASLSDCLRFAFELSSDGQIAGPDWIREKDQRYDIVAKAAPDTPRPEMLRMLQALLIERFKIQMHREPREMSHFVLTVGKGGSKLQPGKEGAMPTAGTGGLSSIRQPNLTMLMLGVLISRFELRAPVLDSTGLPGRYDVKLEWSPANARPDAPPGPSIFTAVQEQLGLRLESRKGPVEVMVIDHAEKNPVEN